MLLNLIELRKKFQSGLLEKADFIKQCRNYHMQLFDYPEFMENTDIAAIEITDQGVCMTTRNMGIKMMISHIDRIAPIDILNFGGSERNELAVLKNLAKKNYKDKFTMIDVGANIGWYSMNFAKSFTRAKIYSFEPVPKICASLLSNIVINGLKNIKTIQAGASDHDGVATFYYDQEFSPKTSLVNISGKKNIEKLKARIVTLDKFCRQKSIRPNLLKIDVEGAELFVLKGARQIISNSHPIIFCEMLRKWSLKFNYHPNQIIEFLRDLDYSCFSLQKDKLVSFVAMTDSTKETNFIFLNQKHHRV